MTEETEEKQGGDQKKKKKQANTQVMSPPSPKGPDNEDEEQGKELHVCFYVGETRLWLVYEPNEINTSLLSQFKDQLQSLKLGELKSNIREPALKPEMAVAFSRLRSSLLNATPNLIQT